MENWVKKPGIELVDWRTDPSMGRQTFAEAWMNVE
jgi:hypothetical protein